MSDAKCKHIWNAHQQCQWCHRMKRDVEYDEMKLEIERLTRLVAKLSSGLMTVDELTRDSSGVAGYHLNGDEASWCSLRTGGVFEETLIEFDEALLAAEAERKRKP